MLELGQVAYAAYCQSSGGRSLASGQKLPGWKDTTPEIREAWRAAADAVKMIIELKEN